MTRRIGNVIIRIKGIKRKRILMLFSMFLFILIGIFLKRNILTEKDKSSNTPEEGVYIKMQYANKDNNYWIFKNDEEYKEPKLLKTGSGYDGKIVISNYDTKALKVIVIVRNDNKEIITYNSEIDDDKKEINLEKYKNDAFEIFITIYYKYNIKSYVETEQDFLTAINNESEIENKVTLLNDINIKSQSNLTINKAFELVTEGNKLNVEGYILFDSDEPGEMKITNKREDDIVAEYVVSDTPLWEYTISKKFLDFKEKKYSMIYAKEINNKEVDTSTINIDSKNKLNWYMDGEKLILKNDTNNILINGEFEIEKIKITRPISVSFSGNVNIIEGIYFESAESGNIIIDSSENKVNINNKIFFDMPNSNVIWNDKNPLEFEYIQKYMNVLTFNKQECDKNIGGLGESKLKSVFFGTEELNIDGNYIYITTNYRNTLNMEEFFLKGECSENGNISVKKINDIFYCIVTDVKNNTRGYKVIVENKKYLLPIISIKTENNVSIDSKETYINGEFGINYNGYGEFDNLENKKINIRGRGNSTWELPKKPYKIKFDSKTSLFGLEESKQWVLLANYTDRSLIRNSVALSMASELKNVLFIPHAYLVDVFVNGQYQGVYSLCEEINIAKGRIVAEEKSINIDTDYLVEFGGSEKITEFGNNMFGTKFYAGVEIKSPDEKVLKKEQYDYIVEYFNKIDTAVESLKDYEKYIDVDSLAEWFILNEFTYNLDGTLRRSNFFLKKKSDKVYVATVWDFDYALGNMSLDSDDYSEWICLGNKKTDAYNYYIGKNWMTYLINDENFKIKIKEHWNLIGNKMYNKALQSIDELELSVMPSATENFLLWNKCFGIKVQYESRNTIKIMSYPEQIEYLRNFIKNRYKWMNETINTF